MEYLFKMDKKSNNIYVWTGIIKENEAFKFTFDETYDHGKVQIMSSSEKKETDVVTLEEGTESDIYEVVYVEMDLIINGLLRKAEHIW